MTPKHIYYTKGYKYQIEGEYQCQTMIIPDKDIDTQWIRLTKGGVLTIRRGYAFDGPSGLTVDTKTFMRGSLEHDALYQLMRQGELSQLKRQQIDKRLRDVCLVDGMIRLRAWWVYRGVRLGGAMSAHPDNRREVVTAP